MIPRTSRSVATIIGKMLANYHVKPQLNFLFLTIPTMLGAATYDLFSNTDILTSGNLVNISVGFIATFITALIVVKALVKFVQNHTLKDFAWYRVLLSIFLFILKLLSAILVNFFGLNGRKLIC